MLAVVATEGLALSVWTAGVIKVQVRNSAGTVVLATLATYSNLNSAAGYSLKSFDLTSFKGQTITIYFEGTEDVTLVTSFVIDDTALTVQ